MTPTINPGRLRTLRLAARLSQRGLASQIGTHALTIQRLEAGNPVPSFTLDTYLRLTKALATTPTDLLEDAQPSDHSPHNTQPTDDPATQAVLQRPDDHSPVDLIAQINENQPVKRATLTASMSLNTTDLDQQLTRANALLQPAGLTITHSPAGYRLTTHASSTDTIAITTLATNSYTTRQIDLLLELRHLGKLVTHQFHPKDSNSHALLRARLLTVTPDGRVILSPDIRWPSDILGVPAPAPWPRSRAE